MKHFTAFLAGLCMLGMEPMLHAQPAYKLDVRTHLKPLATLTLDGSRIIRSGVKDDPGFRLQYAFRKDNKPLLMADARAGTVLDVPRKEAGTYTVVLELFYPAYKGGTQQKGAFKPVSNTLTFRVEAGMPVKVVLVEPPAPPPPPKPAPPAKK